MVFACIDYGLSKYDLCIGDVNNRTITNITNSSEREEWAIWAPSGEWIAYSIDNDIYIIRPDGSEITKKSLKMNCFYFGWIFRECIPKYKANMWN